MNVGDWIILIFMLICIGWAWMIADDFCKRK